MTKTHLEKEIEKKKQKGEERIVVSVSFKFTDPHELSLLEHLWQYRKGPYLKRLIDRDKSGVTSSAFQQPEGLVFEHMESEDDVSSFL